MQYEKTEKGFGYLFVMLMLLIVGAVVIAASAGLATQANVSAVVQNSATALSEAENGLAIGRAVLKAGGSFSSFTLNDNGWNITVSYQSGVLKSIATKGRYSRTVAFDVTAIPGGGADPTNIVNKAIFTHGNLTINKGALNFQNMNYPVYANQNIKIGSGVNGISNCNAYAGGTVTNNSNCNNANQITIHNGSQTYDLPVINWANFTNNPTQTTTVTGSANDISTNVHNLSASGGILWVKVNGPDVYIKGDLNISKEVTVVFTKAPGYTGSYVIHVQTGNFNCSSRLNLLSDQGVFDFQPQANFENKNGLIYTGAANTSINGVQAAVYINTSTNFKIGSIISNGDIYINNANFDYSGTPNWSSINGITEIWAPSETEYSFTNWREL